MGDKAGRKIKNIFVGVAWPYVNGDLHPGHLAGYLLPADILARFQRMRGQDVLMVSGSDCHGTPITMEADKSGQKPLGVIKKYHQKDIELFKLYNLDYNLYTTTTTENHKKTVQGIFLDLLKKGYVSKDVMKQYYSPQSEKFLPDRYVEGECPYCHNQNQRSDQCEACGRWLKEGELIDPHSKTSGEEVILKDTEHYFLNLDKLEDKIKKYVEDHKKNWRSWVFSESLGWINEGLKKRAITRDLDWGVELPIEEIKKLSADKQIDNLEKKRIYVWFEAVIGYLSASQEWSETKNSKEDKIFNKYPKQENDWKKWWQNPEAEQYYFMGQDNLVFHTIMWPGQLMALDEKYILPKNVVVNKFMNYDGQKFSKSKDWTIDSVKLAEDYGVDEIRFYISSVLPENKTSNFSFEGLKETVNGELVAIFGNFFNRVLKVLENKFEGNLEMGGYIPTKKTKKIIEGAWEKHNKYLESCQFVKGLENILALAKFGNQYVDEAEIWKLEKENLKKEQKTILLDILNTAYNLAYLIYPYMPQASKKLLNQFNENFQEKVGEDFCQAKFKKSFILGDKIEPIFRKIK